VKDNSGDETSKNSAVFERGATGNAFDTKSLSGEEKDKVFWKPIFDDFDCGNSFKPVKSASGEEKLRVF